MSSNRPCTRRLNQVQAGVSNAGQQLLTLAGCIALFIVIVLTLMGIPAQAKPPFAEKIDRFIGELGNSSYRTREAANRALSDLGEPAFAALAKAAQTGADPESRNRAKQLAEAIVRGMERRRFDGHAGQVNQIAISRDGRYALSGSLDTTMRLWDVAKGTEVRRFEGHTGGVWAVAFSADGKQALSGGGAGLRGTAWNWDLDPSVRLWDVQTGKQVRRFDKHKGQVLTVAFAPDGKHVVSGGTDQVARLWEIATGQEVSAFEGHTSCIHSVAFSPNGRQLLTASKDGTIRLWNVASGKEMYRHTEHSGWVMAAVFSPDGRKVLSAGADQTVRFWEAQTGKELARLMGHTSMVLRVAFSPDGMYAASGGGCRMLNRNQYVPAGVDYGVRLWDLSTGKEMYRLEDHTGPLLGLVFALDGRSVLSGSGDQTLRLWKLPQ